MKLTIDLAQREEIAAALPLLQLIMEHTPAVRQCGGACGHEAHTGGPLSTAIPPAPEPDAAAVFGGSPLAHSIPPVAAASTAVPPPPASIAPTIPTPGPASSVAAVGSVELDKTGIPWDERIHASTKTKTADGCWKAKRGIAPEILSGVQAELHARVSAAPAVPVPAAPVPAVPAAPSADPADFQQIMSRVTVAVASKLLPATAIGDACVANGLASIVQLQQNPAYIPLVWATLRAGCPALQ